MNFYICKLHEYGQHQEIEHFQHLIHACASPRLYHRESYYSDINPKIIVLVFILHVNRIMQFILISPHMQDLKSKIEL